MLNKELEKKIKSIRDINSNIKRTINNYERKESKNIKSINKLELHLRVFSSLLTSLLENDNDVEEE